MPPSENSTGLRPDTLLLETPKDQIPTAGDRRIADNVSLFLFHTLFLREHNRIASEISQSHPAMTDELVYQKARSINIAQYQNIIMYEYLTSLLGSHFDDLVGQYPGYSEEVDPTTSLMFASVAYRFGHSGLANYAPLDTCGDISTLVLSPFLPPGSDIPNIGQTGGPFNPIIQTVVAQGLENIIRGIVIKKSNRIDLKYVDGVRNIRVSAGVIDLLSLDIIRGRLNGVPDYARFLKSLGDDRGIYSSPDCPSDLETTSGLNQTDPIACFVKIVAEDVDNPSVDEIKVAEDLRNVYEKVLHVDAIIGLLAEPHLSGGVSFSQNIALLTADQFKRSRDGDRFWFENNGVTSQFSSEELHLLLM